MPRSNHQESSSKVFRTAVAYNNAACMDIESRSYERAARHLTKAICLFKKVNRCRNATTTINNNEEETKSRSSRNAIASVDPFMKRFAASGNQLVDDDVVVYDQPIPIPTVMGPELDFFLLDTYQSCFSSIVFFNLAMTYHLVGIQTKDGAFLRKSISLYECSFRSEQEHCQNLFISPFLLASILNNIGHLKQITNSQQMAEGYFQKLFSMLTYLVQAKRINRSDYTIFFGNSTLGFSRSSLSCASAA